MLQQINQNLDEGQSGDMKALRLTEIRIRIRMLITHPDGSVNRAAARELATQHFMCAQTVINFAFGKTVRPSNWTIRRMVEAADFQLVMLPAHHKLPRGAHTFE